jgi:hypothetical protein
MQQILNVSNRKQLFIDERWFASQQGMTLTVNPPIKTEQVLLPETPWENHGIHGYSNVMDDDGVYKMWYDAIAEGFDVKPERRALCYATSSDGIHWERPNVNVFDWEGNPNTNIVMPGANGSVMKDPNGPDEHRYKGLVIIKENDAWEESRGCICGSYDNGYYLELYLVTSPDGIHWKRQSPCALPFFHDTQNLLLFDEKLGRYAAYVRWSSPGRGRCVARVELDNPLDLPWPFITHPDSQRGPGLSRARKGDELPVVLLSDESDPSDTDLYTPSVVNYPWAEDAYFSFTTPYRHYPYGDTADTTLHGKDSRGRFRNDGPVEVQLAVSRDGISWNRPDRQPYIPLGLAGEWDGGQVYIANGMIRKGNEIWQYYCGTHYTHGAYDAAEGDRSGGVGRLVQRLDGFVSADAAYTGGEFTSPLLQFSGEQLALNVNCSAMGEVWVEIQDETGQAIPGYTMSESISVDRNHIAAPVRWQENDHVAELINRPIHLHFKLRACKLYAFQFSD